MDQIKSSIEEIQKRMLAIAEEMTEAELCPKCGKNNLEGLQKICSICYGADEKAKKIKNICENIDNYLLEKGVYKRHLNCSFDNYSDAENKPTVLSLKMVSPKLTESILLFSPTPGTGKTHLAVAVMRNLLLSGYENILFVPSPYIFLEIKQSYDSGSSDISEKQVIDKYSSIGFLVIDDIGAERVSDWAMQIWYMIISRREAELKPTLYTSNLSLGDIKDSLGARISSRLAGGYVFELKGFDYRLKNRKTCITNNNGGSL